jgi:hypothetical protein
MAIAATTAGINTMVTHTTDQCAFACHESDKSPNDYYGLARSLGVTLRMDLLRPGDAEPHVNGAVRRDQQQCVLPRRDLYVQYRLQHYRQLTSSLSTAKSQAGNIDIYEVPQQNWSSDAITNYTNAMNNINSIMPTPGGGTKQAGDSPQEVLFFVTDGVEDEMVGSSRVESLMDPSYCTTIKNRGIRIAVLYTEYLRLPTNPWYMNHIDSFQPNIGATLQSCASPGLYFKVTTNDDISAANVVL